MSLTRTLLVTLAATLVLAPAASAHVRLSSTTPAANASVAAPRSVTATFTGALTSGTINVKNASGAKVSIGTGRRDPRNVKRIAVSLKTGLAAGRYTVRWSIKAADGHSQSGSFTFHIR